MIALALALLAVQGPSPDSMSARAESLLARGDVQGAYRIAKKLAERRPDDPHAHFLFGRVHFDRPVVGRWAAREEFKKAARLAPQDPAPLYWQAKVGFFLRSDDGDRIARDALLQLFAVDPDYLDAWARFRDVYQGPSIWRKAERTLARHGENPIALERRAEMWIALADGKRADSLLALATARRAPTVKTFLLRAEASFLAGNPSAGYAWHDSALAHANGDTGGALWDEAWTIATPSEVVHYETIQPDEMRGFFVRFWNARDPNLLTPENERLGEHYQRRSEARRLYRLLQPQRTVYHSRFARSLFGYNQRRQLESLAVVLPGATGPSSDPFAARARAAMLAWPATTLSDTGLVLAFNAGLTAQGLVFLRHGKPDMQANCVTDLLRPYVLSCNSFLSQEAWLYWAPSGPISVSFAANEYFAPTSPDQLVSTMIALQTDRSTLPAPLEARAWSALFRSSELGLTDVYYRTNGDSAAAALWDTAGLIQPIRASGSGLLLLSVPPGPYHLGVDVDSAGKLGRWRRDVDIPFFSSVDLALSSLVLAPSTVLLHREAALAGMPVDLDYPAGTPLASYVEIYGLTPDRNGRSHYHVRYSFEPVRSLVGRLFSSARKVEFEFDRETESSMAFERLVIEPDRLPAGRYRVTVSVTDRIRNVKSESVALEIEIR